MNIQKTGLRAYSDAVAHFNKVESSLKQAVNEKSPKTLGFIQSAQKSRLLSRSRDP